MSKVIKCSIEDKMDYVYGTTTRDICKSCGKVSLTIDHSCDKCWENGDTKKCLDAMIALKSFHIYDILVCKL